MKYEVEKNLHKESRKEILQLPIGGRVREVSDVQSTSLGSAGQNGIVVGRLGGVFLDGCVCKLGSNVVDGLSNFLHDARHFE